MTFLCFLDDSYGSPGCVFDSQEIEQCDEALSLDSKGLTKCNCPYWKDEEAEQERLEEAAIRARTARTIKADAIRRRLERDNSQLNVDIYAANARPEYITGFGATESNRQARQILPGETEQQAIRRLNRSRT